MFPPVTGIKSPPETLSEVAGGFLLFAFLPLEVASRARLIASLCPMLHIGPTGEERVMVYHLGGFRHVSF